MSRILLGWILLVLFSAAAGCGEDPLELSAPISLNLKAKSDDAQQGVVQSEKSVSSETGDPYNAFMKDVREQLGKENPARVGLSSAELFLGSGSKGVTVLEEIFTGRVDVLFEMDPGKNSYPAAHTSDPEGSEVNAFDVDFSFSDVAEQDYKPLFDGSFKVQIRGPAADGFEVKGAEADLQLTLQFEAFE